MKGLFLCKTVNDEDKLHEPETILDIAPDTDIAKCIFTFLSDEGYLDIATEYLGRRLFVPSLLVVLSVLVGLIGTQDVSFYSLAMTLNNERGPHADEFMDARGKEVARASTLTFVTVSQGAFGKCTGGALKVRTNDRLSSSTAWLNCL